MEIRSCTKYEVPSRNTRYLPSAGRHKGIVVRSVRLPEASPAELLGPLRLSVFAACPAELRGAYPVRRGEFFYRAKTQRPAP